MSGSTTLWATASKEWVIPSKPKPGRKPKKDLAPVANANGQDKDEDLAKGRRVQNRAAQRAFRERKQSQLAELQARILSYEQGEIERNVALQKIAKRLKDENEKLVQENNALKERLAKIEEEEKKEESNDAKEKKRWREDSPPGQSRPVRKRTRTSATPPVQAEVPSPATTLVATPDASEITPPQPAYTIPSELDQPGLNDILDFSTTIKDVNIDSAFPQFNCGFCTDETPCVCRELAMNQLNQSSTQDYYKTTVFTDPSVPVELPTVDAEPGSSSKTDSSMLENLPYQPPVPLRRKPSKISSKSIFPVYPPSADSGSGKSSSSATCSGDPSNCAACNDDAFGKAFCSAIEETVNTRAACENCPAHYLDGPLDFAPRCGPASNGAFCGTAPECASCLSSTSNPTGTTVIQYEPDTPQDFIPTNDAWQRIKAHPNVQFADLSLLAEVVASRSKCTGPRIVLTPPPDHHSNLNSSDRSTKVKEEAPRLVPQEILLECGRRRVREVHSEAVREALRLLDAKFT